jgi:predicted aspartyl protease
VINAGGIWKQVVFLVDTGADCTVFSAAVADALGFSSVPLRHKLGGVGGTTDSVEISTQVRLLRNDQADVVFRGQFGAMTRNEALDISVLGRDITNLFAAIFDLPGNVVALIRPPHRYVVA